MNQASVQEIIRFAITIEEEGVVFYNKYSELAKGDTKNLLIQLASDEKAHAEVFQRLLDELDASTDDYLFQEEVDTYFRSYANNVAFNRRKEKLSSIKEVLQVAIETERLTTEFYRGLIPKTKDEKVLSVLTRLVEEESDHQQVLEDYLKICE